MRKTLLLMIMSCIIGYRLSGEAVTASICIYNLNGQQLKKYPLPIDKQAGKIVLRHPNMRRACTSMCSLSIIRWSTQKG